jgi:hypothetical protein
VKLSKPGKLDGKLAIFSYLHSDGIHHKVINEGDGTFRAISERMLLDLLEGDSP